ncbi:uncharacterized protein ACHE_60531A [Aspergillus chevalieri]|uniref:Uncharacterized protein n=1 Tax=Aspergillus chevalieri TaxID=182096 RepID=A0A7R7VTS0_ASPCH|nr:uncharacterized protein ACHE_60531A [Aspergillus chevalieri]BCR90645.1 hypothetical protein ACHE_60531A [Aspergillus chevalieri]
MARSMNLTLVTFVQTTRIFPDQNHQPIEARITQAVPGLAPEPGQARYWKGPSEVSPSECIALEPRQQQGQREEDVRVFGGDAAT